MKENQKKEQSANDRDTYRSGPADNLGEWFQDVVQDAVDSMDFTGLAQNIRDTVDSIREGASVPGTRGPSGDGRPKADARPQPGRGPRERGRAQRDSRVQTPVSGRQPGKKGWIRRVPGRWSGPIRTFVGGGGLIIFGLSCLGFSIAAFSPAGGLFASAFLAPAIVFLLLSVVSGILLGTGRAADRRVKRIDTYAGLWGEEGFVMLEDLKRKTGYTMKRIRKDIRFLLDESLLPYGRMDESGTCLLLTKEAGEQYDAAMESRRERERQQEEARKAEDVRAEEEQKAKERQASEEAAREAYRKQWETMTGDERKMYRLQKEGGSYLREIRERKQQIHTPEVSEKLERLELLLGRLFVCIKEYPENLSQADRLLDYYLPSVLKLIRVYEDMEKQPIQSVHIIKTRMEIAESLDTVNQALEAMYDDIFQDVAMDISSDIKVLETMLAKDGWGEQEMHSQTEGGNIWI